MLNIIPIAFDDDLEANEQVTKMLIDFKTALNIIWDFIIISFRFYGEPEGLYSCYTSEFKRLDKFFVENSTLPLADSEAIIDIFKHCVNINENLRGQRNIEITTTDANVHRSDTDVVMQETVLPSVTGQIGSSSLTDLPVTLAENQMDTWKPVASTIMQQFQDYDNDGFDMSRCLFDVVQNSKLRFMTCPEVFLFGLKFTDSNSASEWALRSIDNYTMLNLPETFEELQKVPLERSYNFLMSLDTESINKEIARLGVEALMFWELPKVENALNDLCHSWFNTNYKKIREIVDITDTQESASSAQIPEPTITVVGSCKKEKEQRVEIGFVDKLIELWRLRRKILEAKAEISVSGTISKYTYKAGEAIMSKTLTYKSSYMAQLFKARNRVVTLEERKCQSLNMYENYICQYKALLLLCERDFDLMINVRLYKEIIVPIFTIKHGQYAAVALTRSGANKLLRKVWESFVSKRDRILLKEHQKVINVQKKFDSQLLNAQQSAGQQIDDRVDKTLAGLDAKVKSIIKDTVKSQSIKKESLYFDTSLLECDLTTDVNTQSSQNIRNAPYPHPNSNAFKRNRQSEAIDLRSPNYGNKRQDFKMDHKEDRHSYNAQGQG